MKKINKQFIKRNPALIPVSIVVSAALVAAPFMSLQAPSTEAATLDELRARTAQLEQEIKDNTNQAEQLKAQGDTLKNKIAELDLQIHQANTQIAFTETRIATLQIELEQAQTELERQKMLLKASIRALYKRGDASTVEMIVGSDNFSQFIDEQEYLERLKVGVQDSTNKVVALKNQIQTQQNEQIELKKQQEAQRALVSQAKNEQAVLLAETQGQESRYRTRSASLLEEQKKVLNEIVARSRVITGVGTGAYPWASYREGNWTHQGSCNYGDDIDNWGYCYRQCTSYVAWKLYSTGKNPPKYYGDAGNWILNAAGKYETGSQPRPGAIAVWSGFNEGHVAYVEEVNGNQVRISEFNAVPAYEGRYSQRIIDANDPTGYIYP